MKENDVIWVSIEESDKYELSNYGFVRNKYTKKEKSFTYIDNMGVFKFIVINDKIE